MMVIIIYRIPFLSYIHIVSHIFTLLLLVMIKMIFQQLNMRRVATKEHQCRETVNIVKQFKGLWDYFIDFFCYVVDGRTILFYCICHLINHHIYI